jgi:glycosyltransferase involved in cell wall biosynthesis
MDAMASGRPVVATRIAGVPELVEDGVSGYLVAPANEVELAGALERLASSPETRERMGAAGRQKVVADFDAQRCAGQLAELFVTMARPKSTPGDNILSVHDRARSL